MSILNTDRIADSHERIWLGTVELSFNIRCEEIEVRVLRPSSRLEIESRHLIHSRNLHWDEESGTRALQLNMDE